MAQFTKLRNPSKRKHRKHYSRSDADIIASKALFDLDVPSEVKLSLWEETSDRLCGQPSRNIYSK